MEGLMVSAATGVMNSLLGKLATLLTEKYKLQKRVKREITSLQKDLKSINALLERFADREELDPQMKEWRNCFREMAYDIEDCIDKYMQRLENEPDKSSGIKRLLKKKINTVKNLVGRSEIAEQIQQIRNDIADAGRRRGTYNFDEALSSGGTSVVPIDPRMPALHVELENLIGIDGPRNRLVEFVSDVEQMSNVKVVSIVGVGGLGKTTLAGQVYREITELFECRACVSVSQKPDITKILRTVHSQVTKYQECAKTNSMDKDELIGALKDFLKDTRYLIVIDDIWSSEAWESIKYAFPENTRGSRIIVTTRNEMVGKLCYFQPHDHLLYKLSPLNQDESKGLFFRRIFGSENECPHHLKKVAVEIIRKCGGLPLAIITMASLLITKSDQEEWVRVRNSIGVGLEKDPKVEQMRKILSLSYSDLPYQLKTCFLYLSIFPEDYNIDSDRLVRMWIAEGFIKAQSGRTSEQEGECCLNELINRSLIKPIDINYSGQAKTCRVHDMFLDLIISKAGEENFVRLINQKDVVIPGLKVRRLSFDCRDQECTAISGMEISQARSISIFGGSQQQMPLLPDSSALRMVDIEGQLNCDRVMNIEKQFQLRYLRLSASCIEELPKQIGKLRLLETLDVEQTSVRELPASIVQLQHLKNLLVRNARLPAGISKMRSLQKLSQLFVDDSCSVTSLLELGSLTNLTFLGLFWGISDSHADKIMFAANLVSALQELSNLRFLSVSSEESDGSHEFMFDAWSSLSHLLQELTLYPNWYVCKSPRWMASMNSLRKLDIMVNPVTQEALDIFGDLPFLLFLELTSKVTVPEGLIIRSGMFQYLKMFHLYCCDIEKEGLMFHAGAMPSIERLELPFRAHKASDFGIGHLSTLQHLDVRISCRGAKNREVKALKAAIGDAASSLPSNPVPQFTEYYGKEMVPDDDDDDVDDDDDDDDGGGGDSDVDSLLPDDDDDDDGTEMVHDDGDVDSLLPHSPVSPMWYPPPPNHPVQQFTPMRYYPPHPYYFPLNDDMSHRGNPQSQLLSVDEPNACTIC